MPGTVVLNRLNGFTKLCSKSRSIASRKLRASRQGSKRARVVIRQSPPVNQTVYVSRRSGNKGRPLTGPVSLFSSSDLILSSCIASRTVTPFSRFHLLETTRSPYLFHKVTSLFL